jgi:hypothetical protein
MPTDIKDIRWHDLGLARRRPPNRRAYQPALSPALSMARSSTRPIGIGCTPDIPPGGRTRTLCALVVVRVVQLALEE